MLVQRCVFLVCLMGGACSQTDNLLTSPDVDTQSGFFPDSGYLRPDPLSSTKSQNGMSPGTWQESPDNIINNNNINNNENINNNDNKLLNVIETVLLKPKRLQQGMSRLPEEKVVRLEHKQGSVPGQAEDTSYLVLFTGAKDTKL
ncbi:hypothetical protein BsWGS_23542 [Bradybaena similaris]